MARSRKKVPVVKEYHKDNRIRKRSANKKVRHLPLDSIHGKSKNFRKVSESWDISDYRFYCDDNKKVMRK